MTKTEFTTLTSLHRERYGAWAGNRAGHAPDPALCAEQVSAGSRWPSWHQCSRKRGHGPEQAYCAQHNPERIAAKDAERWAKREAEWAESRRRALLDQAAPAMKAALEAIRDGANDPRAIATEALKAFGEGESK